MIRAAGIASEDQAQRHGVRAQGERWRVDHGQLGAFTCFVHDDQREGHPWVPVLTEHMPEYAGHFVYFGSGTSQPACARAFIDLAAQRLIDNPEYLIGAEHLRCKLTRQRRPTAGRT
ncbi:hypothetical protein [uncultured Piscinibacter sp.]|uniref:hypothetical protein n=1 Tax=uncultured Piscinibacter sp. TaxID=1131835 RepID=UPI00345B7F26